MSRGKDQPFNFEAAIKNFKEFKDSNNFNASGGVTVRMPKVYYEEPGSRAYMGIHRLVNHLLALGWSVDRWGHFKKDREVVLTNGETITRQMRFRLLRRTFSVQVRRLATATEPATDWVKLTGGYYSTNVEYLPDGRLRVGNKTLKAIPSIAAEGNDGDTVREE